MNGVSLERVSSLSTTELLQSSENPLDTPDSTVRPSKEEIEEEVQNSPRGRGLPTEVLQTEANPIDSPDSVVRPPVETVLPHQDHADSMGQQRGQQSAANTGAANSHARANISSFLSEQR